MNFLNQAGNIGKGKMTYSLALVLVGYALYALLTGSGDQNTNLGLLWIGLATFGFRRAISN